MRTAPVGPPFPHSHRRAGSDSAPRCPGPGEVLRRKGPGLGSGRAAGGRQGGDRLPEGRPGGSGPLGHDHPDLPAGESDACAHFQEACAKSLSAEPSACAALVEGSGQVHQVGGQQAHQQPGFVDGEAVPPGRRLAGKRASLVGGVRPWAGGEPELEGRFPVPEPALRPAALPVAGEQLPAAFLFYRRIGHQE